jgi:acetylornithine deacetylase/succinyl-diaminopimelate desuccinylase-like protein
MWQTRNIKLLERYIRIKNLSPDFYKKKKGFELWLAKRRTKKAVNLYKKFAESRRDKISGMSVRVLEIEGKTPLIYIDIPGTLPKGAENADKKILLYGHIDKQPPLNKKDKDGHGGWSKGLDPYKPVRRDGRLYGRGSADDGYALPAALTAYELLADQGIQYAPACIIIEASEESGSPDLTAYLEELKSDIGTPDMVVCLDSGAGDSERGWDTNSLRGLVPGELIIEVLDIEGGVHSGTASGGAPDPSMIFADLLSRVVDVKTGKVLLKEFHTDIPPERITGAQNTAALLGEKVFDEVPLKEGVRPLESDPVEYLLNRTWRPALTQIGDSLLPPDEAGNVLPSKLHKKLSFRIPPGVDPEVAAAALKKVLEEDSPFGAKVTFNIGKVAEGWNAPKRSPWLEDSFNNASETYFGNPAAAKGEGGTIPFMKMLGDMFPKAQFLITGVLLPGTNAHGPDEYLDEEYVTKLTPTVAQVIAHHAAANNNELYKEAA